MIKFTKEEISLCKQVAERHRKEIKVGDWIKDVIVAQVFLVIRMVQHGSYLECINEEYGVVTRDRNMVDFPLWTISDCLEFLRKKSGLCTLEIIGNYHRLRWTVVSNLTVISEEGKTPLEACLKVVLAVLEEKK